VNKPRTLAALLVLMLPVIGRAQVAPADQPTAVPVSQFRSIATLAPENAPVYTTCDDVLRSDGQPCDAPAAKRCCSEVWGFVGFDGYTSGSHMAPNGVPFNPLGALDFDFNLGLLPDKELYLFAENRFWLQKAAPGITNPSQGKWDFSKREYDLTLGGAWTYYDSFEFRLSGYSLSNLNRGDSLASPFGFKDGLLLENRYYFGNADIFDVGRLSFLSLGYYPSKSLAAGDGSEFHPGLFGRAYLTYDLPSIRSYVYFDGTYTAERVVKSRLLEMDLGLAVRPFSRLGNLEFRIGYDITGDVQADTTRNLIYGAIRILY
jgi:hypothetical protein